ncbi:glucose 1,6-bisphosphate synthase-like [Megalops cyprinoides]|uniref:glucose 1,6-bisphosphate synthase-like n=1 Tax=Megalops cyprinoides TaxID=118141 RepID=UPI00186512D2|nr:glucose 1,6-bisphosphate synthase-like [Megalops cyprinoides]XP_036380207.1 glucose 1,6-bisphosphate synthase-like [Megalops cyprinoides]XP_036380208.1 glucose 1,6-bisphosphate synthase-like [Megalops cyprinoides]
MGDHMVDLNANLPCHSTGDSQLDKAIYQWITWDKNPRTRAQIEALLKDGRLEELQRRLCSRMSFGTAGLRAAMGAGFALINDLTVIQSTQGMYRYLAKYFPDLDSRGLVVGYDTRGQEASSCSSERLAKLTAAVMLCKDIPVYLFSTYVPTPFVPYAVKKLNAAAGVMITASHNPKEDNGYKVYWENGAQISSPHDKEILKCIEESVEPWSESWNENLPDHSPLRRDPLEDICRCYMEELKSICFHRELNSKTPLKFVHTAFHGVGHDYVQQAFRAFGFPPPIPVPEQKDPDPEFSTVSCPNPEEGESVLELSLRLAEKEGATVVLATDPDADRLAVAEQCDNSRWRVFTGNELAALLGCWMLFNWRETHTDPADTQRVYMLATTVSSKILRAIAQMEGFQFEETLPGFKWIGNKIQELEKKGKAVLFAFEESIGFMCGSMVRDKDGVSAAVVVAEMAAYLNLKNLTLSQQLANIFETYGSHISTTSYVICHDPPTVKRIFTRLRNWEGEPQYPKSCGGYSISNIRDVTTGYDSSQPNLKCVLPITKNSQMVTFSFQNGIVATLRTSGTEPKIKYYTEFCAPPGKRDVSSMEEELCKVTDALVEEFLEPHKNNLIKRSS